MSWEKKQEEPLTPVPSNVGQVTEGSHDAVFGEITGDGPNYRSVCLSSCAGYWAPFMLTFL
jgi:hypothetical protein